MKTLSERMYEKNIKGLKYYEIGENKMIQRPNVIGYAFEDGSWIVYEVDERVCKSVYNRFPTEEEAIEELFKRIKLYHKMGR